MYKCSCSETDMVFANTNGKNLDLKVSKDTVPGLPKCFLKPQGCTVNYIYQDIFCHPNRR